MLKQNTGWNLDNHYHRLPSIFYTETKPTPVKNPKLVLFNEKLADSLGLNVRYLTSDEGVNIFAGNDLPKASIPLAQAYAGHQFGQFTMLGDGRAILLGEQITPEQKLYDIQLKGSGKTPYSRGGDGRAALGPMIREYLISEAMHALEIPTTRALAVTVTDSPVYREDIEKGAILTRVSSSHIRVGTFQYAAAWGKKEELQSLADYTINRHFPDIKSDNNPYLSLLERVTNLQAYLIAKWNLVGFIHGVMNTDNMSISGETIDYGPCAFMDIYDPATVFSSIDRHGRYRFENQPAIGAWNLTRFAETLIPLIDGDEEKAIQLVKDKLMTYRDIYETAWLKGMQSKLGLVEWEENDITLINDLLTIMEEEGLDYTNTFVYLTTGETENVEKGDRFQAWHEKWETRVNSQSKTKDEIKTIMKKNNPSIIPRNYYVEKAIEAAEEGDYAVAEQLIDVLSKPYAYTEEQKKYRKIPKSFSHYQTFCGT